MKHGGYDHSWFWRESIAMGMVFGVVLGTTLILRSKLLPFTSAFGIVTCVTLFFGVPISFLAPQWTSGVLKAFRYFVLTLVAFYLSCTFAALLIWVCRAGGHW